MPAGSSFEGRDVELAALQQALDAAGTGRGGLVFVLGDVGLGKSRLAAELVEAARQRGCRTATGQVPMTAAALPFAPILRAIRHDAEANGPDLIEALPDHHRAELAMLMPELRVGATAPDDLHATAAPQLRTYEALLAYLRGLGSIAAPGVIVLDDLHWADSATTDFVAYAAPTLATSPLLVIATARVEGERPAASIRRWLLELARLEHVSVIELQPLPPEATIAVARSVIGETGAARQIALVAARAGGNPYLAHELGRAVAAGQDRIPGSVQALLEERLAELSAEARHVAKVAAAHGMIGGVRALEVASGMRPEVADAAIRELRDRGVLSVEGGQWSFGHPLLAEMLSVDALPSERAEVHRRWAELLERGGGDDSPAYLVAIARHWYEAGDAGRAVPALVAAADSAARVHAFADAHALYERALALAPQVRPPAEAPRIGFRAAASSSPDAARNLTGVDLHVRAAEAASYAGAPSRAVEILRSSLPTVKDPATRARLRERLASYLLESGQEEQSLAEYAAALQDLGDDRTGTGARILGGHARALLLIGRHADALAIARLAVERAMTEHSVIDEYRARMTLGASLAMLGSVDEGLKEIEAGRRLEESIGSPSRVRSSRIIDLLAAHYSFATVLDRAGRAEASAEAAREGREVAQRLGVRGSWGGLLGGATAHELFELGRWIEAEGIAAELVASDSAHEVLAGHVARARILAARGETDGAAAELEAARPMVELLGGTRARFHRATAELAMTGGDPLTAITAVEEGLSHLPLREDLEAAAELSALGLRAAADGAEAARARGSAAEIADLRSRATILRALATGVDDAAGGQPVSARTAAFRAGAEAEHTRLEGASDATAWERAARLWEQLRAPYRAAYARYRQAEALAHRSDRKAATRALQPAREAAEELAAVPLLRDIDSLARRARLEVARAEDADAATTAGDQAPASSAPDLGLSARELEVLALLTEGKTNREIADELFITEKTAGHHVSSILSKLGVRGRVEAAALAVRMGIGADADTAADTPAAADATRASRCLLFTDIVASTELMSAIGDTAWAELLAWHDRALRKLFAEHDGEEVDHAGDAFFVAFASAGKAIDCAIAIQRALAAHRRSAGFAPRLRIGLHAGEVTREGTAYRGLTVHAAARIVALAEADEILVSQAALTATGRRYAAGPMRTLQLAGIAEQAQVATLDWR